MGICSDADALCSCDNSHSAPVVIFVNICRGILHTCELVPSSDPIDRRKKFAMHTVGLLTMGLWLADCTNTLLFPSEIIKGIENDTFAFKAWKEQTSYPSAHILKVIPTREEIVIPADRRPVDVQQSYDPKDGKREDLFRFAIIFNGTLDDGMLQAGNRLVVVRVTDKVSPEVVGWLQNVLPHLHAQCLHIWKSDEIELARFSYGTVRRYPHEERTFCRGPSIEKPTTDDQSENNKDLVGSWRSKMIEISTIDDESWSVYGTMMI